MPRFVALCEPPLLTLPARYMKLLEEEKARAAVVRAMGKQFIVPPVGTRVGAQIIDFELIRRNDYDYRPVYRTRMSEGILLGHIIGEAGEVAP